jgi:hypothetical protein
MDWRKTNIWLIGGFLISLAIIGMNQSSFNPGRFPVIKNKLTLDFLDQRVRVIGWACNYAAISVDRYHAVDRGLSKIQFAVLREQNGEIRLRPVSNDYYNIESWLPLSLFKRYREHLAASDLILLNSQNLFTVRVPRKTLVIIRGKVVKATGCRIVQRK